MCCRIIVSYFVLLPFAFHILSSFIFMSYYFHISSFYHIFFQLNFVSLKSPCLRVDIYRTHFFTLLTCSVLENIRKATLSVIYKLYPNTENLNDKDKFIWLMTTEDPDMLHLSQVFTTNASPSLSLSLSLSLSEERTSKLNS